MIALSARLNLPTLLTGLLTGIIVVIFLIRLLPTKHVRTLGLLTLLPAPALAFSLPELQKTGIIPSTHLFTLIQGLLISPAALFPLGMTLLTLPNGTTRTAMAMGTDSLTRLRLIWLPLLLPSGLISLTLAILLILGCVILDHP